MLVDQSANAVIIFFNGFGVADIGRKVCIKIRHAVEANDDIWMHSVDVVLEGACERSGASMISHLLRRKQAHAVLCRKVALPAFGTDGDSVPSSG